MSRTPEDEEDLISGEWDLHKGVMYVKAKPRAMALLQREIRDLDWARSLVAEPAPKDSNGHVELPSVEDDGGLAKVPNAALVMEIVEKLQGKWVNVAHVYAMAYDRPYAEAYKILETPPRTGRAFSQSSLRNKMTNHVAAAISALQEQGWGSDDIQVCKSWKHWVVCPPGGELPPPPPHEEIDPERKGRPY